jgi:hypothetical protein
VVPGNGALLYQYLLIYIQLLVQYGTYCTEHDEYVGTVPTISCQPIVRYLEGKTNWKPGSGHKHF